MRQTRPWLHILAVVALMIGTLPVSALAALCQPTSCTKKCCTVQLSEPVKLKGCHAKKGQNKADVSLAENSSKTNGCKCSITSDTSEQAEQTVPATLTYKVPDLTAAVPATSVDLGLPVEAMVLPGVYASDSGPPQSLTSLPWLGRAPPVRLA